MDRIIEIQIRLIIGTVVMWVVGLLIFGTNLTVYGVTNVIRWATYIQGALLIVTVVGWPYEVYNIIIDGLYWLLEINDKYRIFTTQDADEEEIASAPRIDNIEAEQALLDAEKESEKPTSKMGKTAAFLLTVEKSIRDRLPDGIDVDENRIKERKKLSKDGKLRLDALWVALDSVETARMILSGKDFQKWNAASGAELVSEVA